MTTTQKILTLLFFSSIIGCSPEEAKKIPSDKKDAACIPYFQYDEVEHYFFDIPDSLVWELGPKKNKTIDEKKKFDLLMGQILERLSDTTILKDIEEIGFIKTELTKDKVRQMESIFCERKHDSAIVVSCMAIYRDILVFKQKNKIIATAKICFTCGQHVIMGTLRKTDDFGQSGDYGRLYKILH